MKLLSKLMLVALAIAAFQFGSHTADTAVDAGGGGTGDVVIIG